MRLKNVLRSRRAAIAGALLVFAGCTPAPPGGPAPTDAVQFRAELATRADFYSRFEQQVFHRNLDVNNWAGGHNFDGAWSGDHNMSCGGPDTQRTVHASADGTDPEAFWWCAPRGPETGHVMTSMGDIDGYSIVAFAPDRSFRNMRRVCWDVNLTYLGARKWPEMTIISEEDYQRSGRSLAWHFSEANTYSDDAVGWTQTDGVARFIANGADGNFEDGETFKSEDKATRIRHCLTDNGNGTITFRQERSERLVVDTVPGHFPEDARVIFSDHSYSPGKDGSLIGMTWHWDNIEIS